MTYEKAVELAEAEIRVNAKKLFEMQTIQVLYAHLRMLQFADPEMFIPKDFQLEARDALIDLIRFCGPELTQQAIDIVNLKKHEPR